MRFIRGHNTPIRPIADRFWEKVDRHGPDVCWEWQGSKNIKGYGQFDKRQAHRTAWELTHGPIPKGLQILHKCDNPPCCNPAHLFAGTAADNSADMVAKGRQSRGGGFKGEAHPRAKLTDNDVREIRKLHAQGARQVDLTRQYGVDIDTVHRIIKRKTWSHI